ncbi:hypothetical protein RHSIM_Rhsim01G0015700 [Rhododendron simsii]|uniref:Uncharacterized protein n=1 Tax=Rhododendron simsii TaxID=118357 RepID=A0A834LX76_RHOSS|nr:hypothetical protein RHSIM_Rhsim01G0015700 [Rhododendron simsii]
MAVAKSLAFIALLMLATSAIISESRVARKDLGVDLGGVGVGVGAGAAGLGLGLGGGGSGSGAGSGSGSGSGSSSSSGSGSGSSSGSRSEAGSSAGSHAGSRSGTGGTGSGSEAGSSAGSYAGSRSGSGSGSEADSEAGSSAGSYAGSRDGSGSGSEAGSSAGSHAGSSARSGSNQGRGRGSGSCYDEALAPAPVLDLVLVRALAHLHPLGLVQAQDQAQRRVLMLAPMLGLGPDQDQVITKEEDRAPDPVKVVEKVQALDLAQGMVRVEGMEQAMAMDTQNKEIPCSNNIKE